MNAHTTPTPARRLLFELGRGALDLRDNLALRGYGEWTFDNVYAYVYETSADMPGDGHHSFLGEIRDTDFARLLANRIAS